MVQWFEQTPWTIAIILENRQNCKFGVVFNVAALPPYFAQRVMGSIPTKTIICMILKKPCLLVVCLQSRYPATQCFFASAGDAYIPKLKKLLVSTAGV